MSYILFSLAGSGVHSYPLTTLFHFSHFAYDLIIQVKVKGQLSTYFKNVAFETFPEITFEYFTHSFIMEYIKKFKTHMRFQY